MRWIIDGNNLLHRIPPLQQMLARDAEQARQNLLSMLAGILGIVGVDEIVLVFDGRGDRVGRLQPLPGLTVLYSSDKLSADAVIERLVSSADEPSRWRVVTSDRMERETAHAAGAETMGCGDFIDWMEQQQRNMQGSLAQRRRREVPPTLGDLFPKGYGGNKQRS